MATRTDDPPGDQFPGALESGEDLKGTPPSHEGAADNVLHIAQPQQPSTLGAQSEASALPWQETATIEFPPVDYANWIRDPLWPLFGAAMLLVGLEPTELVFSGSVSVPQLVAAIPDAVRDHFKTIYRLSKSAIDNGTLKWTTREASPKYPRLYVDQGEYLAWAKAQGFAIPNELQQSKQRSRHWIRQDTGAEVTRVEVITPNEAQREFADRIPDGKRILERMFDKHGIVSQDDIDSKPMRVVWSESGQPVKGKYVADLVRACLEPLCTKPRVTTYLPGKSGRVGGGQNWGGWTQGNRGGSLGNDEDS